MNGQSVVMVGPGQMSVLEMAIPDRAPSDGALIKVLANGICGSDWDLFSGELAMPGGRPPPFPMIPGHEPVGRVVAIDESASRRWGAIIGDRVVVESKIRCGECQACISGNGFLCAAGATYSLISLNEGSGLWGGMSEYMVLRPNSFVFRVPDNVTDEDATFFNPLGNALYWTVDAGRTGLGDRVLILGGGQRGLCCCLAAHEAGASQVIVTGLSKDAHKLALAPEFGATHCIDAEQVDTVEAIKELTDGIGVDVVVDTVPQAMAPIRHAIEVLRPGGTLVVAGVRNPLVDSFPLERLRSKQLHLVGVSGTTSWAVKNAIRILASERFPFHRLQSHSFPLDRAADAIRTLGGQFPHEDPIHVVIKPQGLGGKEEVMAS